MTEPEPGGERTQEELQRRIARRAERRQRAERERRSGVWFGLGMFGLVGWSVALPTVLGIAAGVYLDEHHPVGFSWTLTLLFVGVALGCLNAGYWVVQERRRGGGDGRA